MRPRRLSSSSLPTWVSLDSRATEAWVASVPATTTPFLSRGLRSWLHSSTNLHQRNSLHTYNGQTERSEQR